MSAIDNIDVGGVGNCLHAGINPNNRFSFEGVGACIPLLFACSKLQNGTTPCTNQDDLFKIVQLLLQYKANANAVCESDNKTALHVACQTGNLELVKLLMEWEADLFAQDITGSTPLHYAALNGFDEGLNFLVEHESFGLGYRFRRESLLDQGGCTPLHDAARSGKKECVKILLGIYDPDIPNKMGNTPLHYAAMHGHQAVVDLLLNRGADLERKNKDNKTSRDLAQARGYEDVVLSIDRIIQTTLDMAEDSGNGKDGRCVIS